MEKFYLILPIIWCSLGFIFYIITHLAVHWTYTEGLDISSVYAMLICIIIGPIASVFIISVCRKSSDMYIPKHSRFKNLRYHRKFTYKDIRLFGIMKNEELKEFSGQRNADTINKMFNTGYFRTKAEIVKFITTRNRDYKLYLHVQKLMENE